MPSDPRTVGSGSLTIGIVGLGLLGASLALALRERSLARSVIGTDASAEVRAEAVTLEICDDVIASVGELAARCDIVFLCVPVGAYGAVVGEMAESLRPGTILSDVGSVKSAVIRNISSCCPDGVHFVPGHPIAGAEKSGPSAGRSDLFSGRWFIITPTEACPEDAPATRTIARLWTDMGSQIAFMTPEHHDLVLAVTSHLPHLIAFNIVGTADDLATVTQKEVIKFSAGGFRDFTRIAASDPTMWRDVFLNNRDAVLKMLDHFTSDLEELRTAIQASDGEKLHAQFTRTRAIRRQVIDAGQDTPAEDFGRSEGRFPAGGAPTTEAEVRVEASASSSDAP